MHSWAWGHNSSTYVTPHDRSNKFFNKVQEGPYLKPKLQQESAATAASGSQEETPPSSEGGLSSVEAVGNSGEDYKAESPAYDYGNIGAGVTGYDDLHALVKPVLEVGWWWDYYDIRNRHRTLKKRHRTWWATENTVSFFPPNRITFTFRVKVF